MPGTVVDALKRNKVRVIGNVDARHTLVFVHGIGSDQAVWSQVTAPFERSYCLVLLDHVGSCQTDAEVFIQDRYLNLSRYAQDLVEVCEQLGLKNVILVGHSVGGMIAALATLVRPALARALVMIGSSPRYRDDGEYRGGMTATDISNIYSKAMADYASWSSSFAKKMMANAQQPQLAEHFAEGLRSIPRQHMLTVLCSVLQTDYRKEMAMITVPTLLLQARRDPIVPQEVAEYLHGTIRNSRLVLLDAEGHLPHVSAPSQVVDAIAAFLAEDAAQSLE